MTYWASRVFCVVSACAALAGVADVARAQDNAALLRQARVFVEAERYKDAVAVLKTLEPQSREDEVSIGILTGKIYLAIDRPAKAVWSFEEAQAQAPERFDAALGAAQTHLQLGQFKQARRFVQSAQTLKPVSSEPDFVLAAIALRTGNASQAHAQMLGLLKQGPDSEGVVIAYSKYLALTGDSAGAKTTLARFAERNANAAAVREQLGELEIKSGNLAAGLQLKRLAASLYDKQGDFFRRDVTQAWLEVNGLSAPPAAPEAKAVAQQSREAKTLAPVAADRDFAPPVKRFPFPAGVTITGGSGFIVDGGRKIVTNRHVVEGGKEFAVRTGLGEIINARLLFLSPTDDLAVLELEKPLAADRAIPANAYAKPGVGRNVVVMGYPLWSVLGEGSPSLTNGMVSKRTGLQDDKGTFQLTAKVNKGNSGGPVFDLSGHVVGITVGKLDTKKFQDDQGFVPEDVNFAIHVDRLPPIANIQLANNAAPMPELGTEELYQKMLGKVVMVATYK
jgi:S1-C subfamily serine protease